jgi:hypothetical protein
METTQRHCRGALNLAVPMTSASPRFDELAALGKARLGHISAKIGLRVAESVKDLP